MSSRLPYETLIFDLDGTISDPFVGLSQSINFALEAHGFRPAEPQQIRPLIGPPLHEIFPTLVGPMEHSLLENLIDSYRDHYGRAGYAENTIYDGIPETIEDLAQAGFRLGVCTAKREDYACKIIAMFGLTEFFEFIDGGAGIGKHKQLERIVGTGIDASTAIMIGDRDADLLAANANSIQAAGVLWGFGELAELTSANPAYLLKSPEELRSLFL